MLVEIERREEAQAFLSIGAMCEDLIHTQHVKA